MRGVRRKHVPLRTCIACQQQRAKRELIRVVRTPEGVIEIDPKGKRSGRGAYLCCDRDCLDSALAHRKLGHALKCQVSEEQIASLREQVESLLEQRIGTMPGPSPVGPGLAKSSASDDGLDSLGREKP